MGSLSNLYISQSFQSLIHLGSNITASTTQVELEDGLGNGLGIFVNTLGDVSIDGKLVVSGTFDIEGKITVNDDVRVNGNLSVSGATSLTGSLDVTQNITASNALIENDLIVSGTLFASKVVTLIESSSIIYSSGSNILGDEVSDTQTLIGSTIMSGSASLTGSMGITNNLSVTNNISSSTISGIGNVTFYSTSVDSRLVYIETTFSTSVDSRLDYLEVPFSTSVDNRLDLVEATASYLNTTFSTSVDSRLDYIETTFSTSVDSRLDLVEATASYLNTTFSTSVDSRLDYLEGTFSTSVDSRLDNLEAFSTSVQLNFVTEAELAAATASLISQINTKLNTSSFNAYTQSADTALNNLSSSISASFVLVNNVVGGLSAKTGSYATTGSNNFIGNQTITGSLTLSSSAAVELQVIGNSVFSGSFRGGVINLSVASQTASMDFSLGNFYTLNLPSSSITFLNPINIRPGQTTQLLIRQGSVTGSLSYPTNLLFPTGSEYTASRAANAADIISFVSFDTASLYAVSVKNLV